ncbi:MAG: FecR domain-containing protein [Caulobacterales bacterium]|nr:FecR domain-containing protein [Caulobacterales bacterium]
MTAPEAAAQWFARLNDDGAGETDWQAFEAWLSADAAHADAYARLERIWVELEDMAPEAVAALGGGAAAPIPFAPRPKVAPRRGWLYAGAGLAAGLTVAVVGVANWPKAPAATYAAAPGQTRQVALADGSKVWLNAQTHLSVRLGQRERAVELADGEAAFDVTHDPARPFEITVGDRDVRVVGTQFDLRRRDGEITLTVRRGTVEVRPAGEPQAAPTRVTAGQRLTHHEGAPGSMLLAAEPEAAFAWTEGRLVYSAAPLREVAADLSRSLGVPVRVADASTGQLRFSGVLALDDKAAVLRRLQAFAPVRAEPQGGGYVLSRR